MVGYVKAGVLAAWWVWSFVEVAWSFVEVAIDDL
jgi:hypothetical protein